MKTRIQALLGAAAILAGSTVNAASIGFDTATTSADTRTAQFSIILDTTGVSSGGGGAQLAFSGAISFVSFAPSAYFSTFDTDPSSTLDFSGAIDPAGPNPFEIFLASFSAQITGLNSLGTITVNIAGPGQIDMIQSPIYGTFVDFTTGDPLPGFTFGSLTATAVPLPAAAWLFATGMGFIGWRHSRKRQ